MLKYYDYGLSLIEVPNEIALIINITACPYQCPKCSSPWLRKDIGKPLNVQELMEIIKENPEITCVCFMGGDSNHEHIIYLSEIIHNNTKLKVAMYSGDEKIDPNLVPVLDYYKIGPYIEKYGPLSCETTNQRMYKVGKNKKLTDITKLMQKKGGIFYV